MDIVGRTKEVTDRLAALVKRNEIDPCEYFALGPKEAHALLTSLRLVPKLMKVVEAARQEHGGIDTEPECQICHALAELKEAQNG